MRILNILASAAVLVLPLTARAAPATAEATTLGRVFRYCGDPNPKVVAGKVAAAQTGKVDEDGLARMAREASAQDGARRSPAFAWTLRDEGTWKLRTNITRGSIGVLTECTVTVTDLREAEMERVLATDPRLSLIRERESQGGWVREYRLKGGRDLTLLYWTKMFGPASSRRTHILSMLEGKRGLRAPKAAR